MKKLVTIAVFLFASLGVFAQMKGEFLVEGGLSFKTEKQINVDERLYEVQVKPLIGYFIEDNWALGLRLGYQFDQYYLGGEKNTRNQYMAGPFARYYMEIVDGFYYTPGVGVDFAFGQAPMGYGDMFGVGASLDLLRFELMATDCLGISFSAGSFNYMYLKYDAKDSDDSIKDNTFDIGFNLAATVAFSYYF